MRYFNMRPVAAGLLAVLLSATASMADTTLVVAGAEAPGALLERMGQKFATLVAKKSDGRVTANFIPGQSLGSGQQVMEAHQAGSVDVMFSRPDWFTSNVPDFQVMSWGFTFRDREHLQHFLDSDVFNGLVDEAVDKMGVRILSATADQPRVLFTRKPVKSLIDIAGMKMRVPGIKAYIELWKTLGTVPTQIAWAEAFLALKTGVVDGAEADFSGAYSQRFHIAAPNILLTDHVFSAADLSINEAKWQSLSDEDKKAIQAAADEAIAWMGSEAESDSRATMEKMVADGATVTPVDRKPFEEKSREGAIRMEKEGLWATGLWQKIRDVQ